LLLEDPQIRPAFFFTGMPTGSAASSGNRRETRDSNPQSISTRKKTHCPERPVIQNFTSECETFMLYCAKYHMRDEEANIFLKKIIYS
jgi:hypothetical protein